MFVVVNVKESGKRRIRKGRTVDKVREIRTSGSERFYIADVLDSSDGVNWNEVAAFLGRHSRNVLTGKNILLPESCPVRRYDAAKYKNILLFNTAEMILKQAFLAGCRTECVIYDRDGKYSFLLHKAVRFACHTTVVTDKEYLYFSAAASLYKNIGASVTVTDKSEKTSSDTLVVDTDGVRDIKSEFLLSVNNNGAVPKYTEGLNDLKCLCPEYIDTIDFLGAVYEYNGDKRPENAVVRVFSKDGENITTARLIEKLICRKTENMGKLFLVGR